MAKILFSQYFQMEQLGIMSLAAILKRSGNECRMAIGEKDVLREIASWQPDVLAATCYSGQEEWWTNLFAAAKKLNPKIITITGGPGPSFDPEIISSPQVDVVCRGEGDQSILEFIAKFNKNEDFSRTPNLWLKKNGTVVRNEVGNLLEDLDTLPFPDREIYQPYPFIYNNPTKHVLISRGCLFKCSFCYNSKWSELYENKGRYLRLRSIDNVIAELAELKEKYAFSNFLFRDSNFLIKKDWILAFLKEYQKKIGIPFYCNVIASLLDEEIVQALKESGCFLLAFGVESADEDYRMNVLNKKVTDRQIRSAAELLHRYQVPFYTTNMLGLPGEDLNSALATIRMNLEIKPAASWFAIYTPYPEEPLTEYARGKGYLKDTKLSLKDSSSYNRSLLKQKDIGQVENLQKLVYLIFAFPPFLSAAKVLIKLPYNFCFKIIHDITYLFVFCEKVPEVVIRPDGQRIFGGREILQKLKEPILASVNELKCNLCGSSERATVYIKDNVHILRCAQCGLLFNQEMKRPEDLSRIYSEDYFVGGDIGYGYDDYPAQRDNLLRTFRNRFKVVEQYKGPGRLLSVGCGLGCCVQVAREKNWQAQAVEISGFACEWMKRNLEFGAHNCALKDAHFPDNHFDVVLMWGYIQESLDPLGEIKEVYRILKPGGMLFLQAQNTDSLYARLAREKWIQFKPRTTAYYFSRKTARMLLEKAGFKVLKITPSGMGQYCSVDFLLKRITHLVPALERINQLLSGNGRLKRTSVYINLFDLLHLYAKKEDNNG